MTFVTRTTLILTLLPAMAGGALAQENPAPATATTTAAATTSTAPSTTSPADPEEARQNRLQVREAFGRVLNQHPSRVSEVLALDPTLVSNEPFLAQYPELAQFISEHPEIRRNPHYYMREFERPSTPMRHPTPFEQSIENLTIMFTIGLVAGALAWLVRTIIEQRRWNQLSKRQSEVHNKILDRFNNSEELLAYIKTPAGTKFLESAPIALHTAPPKQSGPNTRLLWSIQIGVIVAITGLGMLLLAAAFSGESAQGFFAMGVIAFCIGAGFIASSFVSIVVARRLAPWQEPETPELMR